MINFLHTRRFRKHHLLWVGVAVCTLFIWSNSLAPASQSAGQSLQVLSYLAPALDLLGIGHDTGHALIRKLAHMSEFGLLGVLWASALLRSSGNQVPRRLLDAAGLCLVTGLIDETIQLFSPGRGSLVSDVWIDFLGSCLGIAVAFVFFLIWQRHRIKSC